MMVVVVVVELSVSQYPVHNTFYIASLNERYAHRVPIMERSPYDVILEPVP